MIKKVIIFLGRVGLMLVLSPFALLGVIVLSEGLNDPAFLSAYPIALASFSLVLLARQFIKRLFAVKREL